MSLGSLHYSFLCTQRKGPRKDPHGAWLLVWMWVVDMLLKLNGLFSDQLIHLWDTTIPYCLYVVHMPLWLCVLVIIQRDHMVKINYESFPFYLSLVFHLYPTLANCLNFVTIVHTRDFQRIQCFFKDTSISELHNLSWVLISSWSNSYLGCM